MLVIQSYTVAVVLCFITMLYWGSWANTQKLASKEWRLVLLLPARLVLLFRMV